MKITPEQIVLEAKVIGGMLEHARYIRDELGFTTYPGMLRNMGVPWEVGDSLRITIERIPPEKT